MIYKDKLSGLTAKTLKELLTYNPRTGVFRWRTSAGHGSCRREAGSQAGTRFVKGWRIELPGTRFGFLAHRLAWLYMTGNWPENQVDHWNRDCWDNRWKNLRAATNSQNQVNRGLRPHNKSGVTGVGQVSANRWYVECQVNGVRVFRGSFKTRREAVAARLAAVKKHHGQFAVVK